MKTFGAKVVCYRNVPCGWCPYVHSGDSDS